MELERENKRLKVLIVILLVFLVAFGGYYSYINVIKDNNKNTSDNKEVVNDIITSVDDEFTINDDLQIDFEITSFDNVEINVDSPNNVLNVTGKMNLSYDQEDNYIIRIGGYCLDKNKNKYFIHGPGAGAVSFYSSDNNYTLINSIGSNDGDVILADGTPMHASDIDWNNVKITYCMIDKLLVFDSEKDTDIIKKINYEHYF